MANYDESDEDIFIIQSSYSNCSPIGSDTDEVLNYVLLELEASKYVKGSSSFLAEISSEDDELLSSTLKAEREFSGNRQEAEESKFGSPLAAKDLQKLSKMRSVKTQKTRRDGQWVYFANSRKHGLNVSKYCPKNHWLLWLSKNCQRV